MKIEFDEREFAVQMIEFMGKLYIASNRAVYVVNDQVQPPTLIKMIFVEQTHGIPFGIDGGKEA